MLKRQDGSVDFYRNWSDYKSGFGNLEGEHCLGLDNMYLLTTLSGALHQLRVDLADWEGNTAFAKYDRSQLVLRTVTTPSPCQGISLPVQLETHLQQTMGTTMEDGSAHLIETMMHGLITVLCTTMDLGGTMLATTAS